MKRLMLVTAAMLWGNAVMAHPPKNIVIDVKGSNISLAIEHQVKDPAGHYIDDVIVSVNGKKMITQKLIRQEDGNSQTAVYNFPGLKKGDTISVEADCNKFGKKKQEITL